MVGTTMSTGTGGKPDMPWSQAQMAQFDGEIIKLFWAELPERKRKFSSWVLKNIAVNWILAKKMAFLLWLVQ